MENFKTLDITDVVPNDNDTRKVDSLEQAYLTKSLDKVGMIEPIVVYPRDDGKYIILSGFRRYTAAKQLGWDKVTCKIVDKPEDDCVEQEYLAQANMHRSSPDALKNEVDIMDRAWNTMQDNRKNHIESELLDEFRESNENNPRYVDNPDAYTRRRFSAVNAYVAGMTGLSDSNPTVKRYLKNIENNEAGVNEANVDTLSDSDTSPRTPKPVTLKSLERSAKTFLKKLKSIHVDNRETTIAIEAAGQALTELISAIDAQAVLAKEAEERRAGGQDEEA